MQNQGFFGATFTYEDMVQARLARSFRAELKGRSGSETTLELLLREGATSGYPRLEVVIDSTKGGVTKIRYYDARGGLVREQLREDWIEVDAVPQITSGGGSKRGPRKTLTPTKITMRNVRTGDKTVIRLSNLRVNQGVKDDTFSRRVLMRG
jgi:hypothetical protein